MEIAPRLLGFLSLARQTAMHSDLLFGEAGQLCILPGDGPGFSATAPRHFSEVRLQGDRVEIEGGTGFRVVETRTAQGALEIATAVATPAVPLPRWRQRVLFALRDADTLGHVVRALLERGHDGLTFGRVEPGSVHPGTEFVLLVRQAPLYVVLEVMEEGLGTAFYEACHSQEHDKLLGLYLPWGMHFPLVAAINARLERPLVRHLSGHLVNLNTENLTSIDAVLSPEIGATVLSAVHVPHDQLRVRVPLRLQALDKSQASERTELWRVGPESLDQLASELACPEDRLAHLLAQVVRLDDDRGPSVFIWSPTHADDDGEQLTFSTLPGYSRTRRRLANLLLPSRHAILPTLADETLRSQFGLRQGVMTVLDVAPGGGYIQYGLQLAHFQPLRRALVDYVLQVHEEPLAQLCAPSTFNFETVILPAPDEPEVRPEASPPARSAESQPPTDDHDEEEPLDTEAEPLPSPPQATPSEIPPEIHWPTRLEQATQALIAAPDEGECWLHFLEASAAMRLRQDAMVALLHALATRGLGRNHLAAALGIAGRAAEHTLLLALASQDAPMASLEEGLEQVLTLALVTLDPPAELSVDMRRGLARLPSRLRALGAPRLTWTAARLAWQLTRDSHLLEETRLWLEPGLLSIRVHNTYPPQVVHELEARNAQANQTAVQDFAEGAALGPAERVFLRLAYALRLVVLGGGVDHALLTELAKQLEGADLGASATLARSALQTLVAWEAGEPSSSRTIAGGYGNPLRVPIFDHPHAHGLAGLSGYAVDPNLRTVLIEEGFLPPINPTEETQILQRGAELATATEADATQGILALFDQAAAPPARALDALFAVVSRLRSAGQREAMAALFDRVNQARAQSSETGRSVVGLAGLANGLNCALHPEADPGPALADLVTLAAHLPVWDRALGLRAVLSALEPLPVKMRRARAVPLYQALRTQGVLHDWSGQQAIRVDEQRVLFRLVNLLVVPVDEMPEGERLRHAEWTALRETIRRDLEAGRTTF